MPIPTEHAVSPATRTRTLIPIVRELPADLETPVSVYLKLAGARPSFLLESITGGEHLARYSFIGVNPSQAYVLRGRTVAQHGPHGSTEITLPDGDDPLDFLRGELGRYNPVSVPGLPRFSGGLVGYLGYDTVRFFEPSLTLAGHPDLPDAVFLLADTVVAFDHAFGRLLLITHAQVDDDEEAGRAEAEARLQEIERRIAGPAQRSGRCHSQGSRPARRRNAASRARGRSCGVPARRAKSPAGHHRRAGRSRRCRPAHAVPRCGRAARRPGSG